MTNLLILVAREHHVTSSAWYRCHNGGHHRRHVGRMLGRQLARMVTDQATKAELAIRIRAVGRAGPHGRRSSLPYAVLAFFAAHRTVREFQPGGVLTTNGSGTSPPID